MNPKPPQQEAALELARPAEAAAPAPTGAALVPGPRPGGIWQ